MPRLQSYGSQSVLPTHLESPAASTASTVRHGNGTRLRATSSTMNMAVKAKETAARKIPLKSMSFGVQSPMIRSTATAGQMLPSHRSPAEKQKSPPSRYHSYQASEKGKGDVLPTTLSRSKSALMPSPIREGYATDSGWSSRRRTDPGHGSLDAIAQKLRSRRRTASTEDLTKDSMYSGSSHHVSAPKKDFPGGDLHDYNNQSSKYGTSLFSLKDIFSMRKREWLQIFVIIAITFLVFDSYKKAMVTSERLELFQEHEGRMMLHLQRIEQHSKHLHESMISLSDVADMVTNADSRTTFQGKPVDSNLIRVQAQQLHEMEEELDHELQALQTKMQNVARSGIVRTYGEGPVQVTLDLNFPGNSKDPGNHNVITILLWYDTPHAAWTWLQQIRRGEWNGAPFTTIKSGAIDSTPMIANTGSLDFVEKSQKAHEAWTVGLSDHGNSLGLFINLQDNSATRKHDVCVGKVIDGFDALQRLVDVTRAGKMRRSVTINRASATHLSAPTHDRL